MLKYDQRIILHSLIMSIVIVKGPKVGTGVQRGLFFLKSEKMRAEKVQKHENV